MKMQDYASAICTRRMPVREKKIKKLGTIKPNYVESTPFVWNDELMIFEWIRADSWAHNGNEIGCYHIVNLEKDTEYAPFGYDHAFGSAYEEGGTVYVHGVKGSDGWTNQIDMFWSSDLENWQEKKAVICVPEDMCVFNTSVCKDRDGYVMAIEVGTETSSHPVIGCNFTMVFAKSKDLFNWELLPIEDYIYSPERYTACPSIRYFDGYYYMVNLEQMPFERWIPYIVRTKDLLEWEIGDLNPFLMYDDDDKKLVYPERLTAEEKEYVYNAYDCNNSDVDFCDYKGKTVIMYSWGNQHGKEFLAMAEYDGSLQELLESFFLN